VAPAGGLRLIADIGGTNARFALQTPGGPPGRYRVLKTADYPSLAPAIRDYLSTWPDQCPDVAAIAVAAPITGDQVRFTNAAWSFSRAGLPRATGIARVHILNVFQALAWALTTFDPRGDLAKIGRGRRQAGQPMAVFGAGTGLGVSCFIPQAAGGPAALATEGGHASLAAASDREAAVIAQLRKRFGHVSAERVLSGPGLANLYSALTVLDGAHPARSPTPAAISRAAKAGRDPRAVETAALFSGLLGQFAGDLALQFGARGGVHIAGGVIAGLGTAFDRTRFRRRFEDKGRYRGWLAGVGTYLITHKRPAIAGLVRYLDEVEGAGG
jgi:glucokinase